ncbi:MAG: hypothetical protein WA971_06680, partial [Microbacterium sp.]
MSTSGALSVPGGDRALIGAARSGDRSALDELIGQHLASGRIAAVALAGEDAAETVLEDGVARATEAVLRGDLPDGAFRAAFLAYIRQASDVQGRTVLEPPRSADPGDIASVFGALSADEREALWYADVEQLRASHAAALLGVTVGESSERSIDARAALQAAWVRSHSGDALAASCRWFLERLGYGPGARLGERAQERRQRHLNLCGRCREIAGEAVGIADRLPLAVLTSVLGAAAAAEYHAAGGQLPVTGPIPISSASGRSRAA